MQFSRLYPDGTLLLVGDPDQWILNNPDDCVSLASLELIYRYLTVEKIDTISRLHNLQRLLLDCDNLPVLPPNLGDLKSLTHLSLRNCYSIKHLPSSIGKLSNLTALHLNSCYFLTELPADLGELSELSLINIQSTDIKWLPWSITKLSKLCLLFLPRYFRHETLPDDLIDSVVISVEGDHVRKTWRELKTEIDLFSIPIVQGSQFSGRTDDPIDDNTFSSSQNHDKEILLGEIEDWAVPVAPDNYSNFHETDENHIPNNISQVHADPNELGVSENNLEAFLSLPNQSMEMLPSRATNPNSINLHESSFEESSQQVFQNRRPDNTNVVEIGKPNAAFDSTNPIDDRSNEQAALEIEQVKKTHNTKITPERIEELISQNMRLVDAAKLFRVSRSTLKRRLKDHGKLWKTNRKKEHQGAKKKNQNTKSPCGRNAVSNHLTSLGYVVHNETPDAIRCIVEEPSLEAHQCHMDGQVEENLQGATTEPTLSNTSLQPADGNLGTFVVKATCNGDTVRFYFSLRHNIEQLQAEVGKRLNLEVGKFKMKYLDEDNEWMLMAHVTDLKHAMDLSKSSGSNVVRLSIVDYV